MTDATAHPRGLSLPRTDEGLATTPAATRRMAQLLPAVLEEFVAGAGADGAVVALDGGVDTTVTATLAVDALGTERVTALEMPATMTDEASAREAEAVAAMLDVDYRRFPLQPVLAAFQETVGESGQPGDDLCAVENALDRLRMTCAYYVANTSNALVVGAVNRTRRLLGPTTKHGDTGVDLFLLGDLYRTEVDALARSLDIPDALLDRSSDRHVGTAETNAEQLELPPRTVDRALRLFVDEGRDPPAVAGELDVDPESVARLARWCAQTRHERHQPPKPSTRR